MTLVERLVSPLAKAARVNSLAGGHGLEAEGRRQAWAKRDHLLGGRCRL